MALDVGRGEELESRTTSFEERGESREAGFFDVAVDSGIEIQANLEVFGLGVFNLAGLDLSCADPGLQALTICFEVYGRGALTTQVTIELSGWVLRNGSSLPTPFWMMTRVDALTDCNCDATAS